MKPLLLVFLGGGLGSTLRYGLGKYLNSTTLGFPYGTFTVNLLGSLLIGIILGMAAKHDSISQNTMLLVATGFAGGFTTFSTFAYENHIFLKNGEFGLFALYTFGSFIIAFGSVFFGIWVVKVL
jgi:fluoride exporter